MADVFHAAVAFLNGAERYLPGKVYGFLERPVGVAAPVTVKAADVRAAAKKLAVRRHLPVVYDVGGVKVGPADFLFAMLDALDGVEDVRVVPREQLGDVAAFCPPLEAQALRPPEIRRRPHERGGQGDCKEKPQRRT